MLFFTLYCQWHFGPCASHLSWLPVCWLLLRAWLVIVFQTRALNDGVRQQWLQLSDEELQESIDREEAGEPLRKDDFFRGRRDAHYGGDSVAMPQRWYIPSARMLLPVLHGAFDGRHMFESNANVQEAATELFGLAAGLEYAGLDA